MQPLSQEQKQALIQAAGKVRAWAYAPYSNYRVGAAVLTVDGQLFTGVNVENAAYPNGICAERVALFKAISEGQRQFTAIAVVSANGGSPSGACPMGMPSSQFVMTEPGASLSQGTIRRR